MPVGVSHQFSLWDGRSIQEQFETFRIAHPEVLPILERLTDQALSAGMRRIGIGFLWERMRWTMRVERRSGEDYKLNNNYRSRYVRLLIELHPEWESVFETRELRAV